MKKTLKAVALVAGFTLLSSPAASFAATSGTKAVQYHNQWVKKGSYWVYYNANGALQKGWLSLNNKWYYFDTNGYMKTGWVSVNSKWYYLDANGVMKTGWVSVNSKWYYLDASGVMKTGWVKVNNQWYFMDNSGVMKTGWVKSGSDWYYLNANGTMKTGWLQSNGKSYFLDRTSGKMTIGWKDIDGKTYYFYNTGIMAVNTTIEGKQIGADGAVVISVVGSTLEQITAIAKEYGVTVEVDPNTDAFDLYNGDVNIGFAIEQGLVIGDPAYGELFTKLALSLGVPVTEAELKDLIAQAHQAGEVQSGGIDIYIDESTFLISWGSIQ